jgi:hypothetical protein
MSRLTTSISIFWRQWDQMLYKYKEVDSTLNPSKTKCQMVSKIAIQMQGIFLLWAMSTAIIWDSMSLREIYKIIIKLKVYQNNQRKWLILIVRNLVKTIIILGKCTILITNLTIRKTYSLALILEFTALEIAQKEFRIVFKITESKIKLKI